MGRVLVAVAGVLLVLLVLVLVLGVSAQISQPVARNSHIDTRKTNKFLQREPIHSLEQDLFTSPALERCAPPTLQLLWTKEMESSIYSTPVIADLHFHKEKEIVASTLIKYIEVMHGENGAELDGWPFVFSESSFHTSPLLEDVNGDGLKEIVVTTLNGEIVFFRKDGTPLSSRTMRVEPLQVARNWYVGLDEHGVMVPPPPRSKAPTPSPPVEKEPPVVETPDARPPLAEPATSVDEHATTAASASSESIMSSGAEPEIPATEAGSTPTPPPAEQASAETPTGEESAASSSSSSAAPQSNSSSADPPPSPPPSSPPSPPPPSSSPPSTPDSNVGEEEAKEEDTGSDTSKSGGDTQESPPPEDAGGELLVTDEDDEVWKKIMEETDVEQEASPGPGVSSRRLLQVDEASSTHEKSSEKEASNVDITGWLTEDGAESLQEMFADSRIEGDLREFTDTHHVDPVFGDLPISHLSRGSVADDDYVYLDGHVLATPVVADLNGDGKREIIIPVTYFLDRNDYASEYIAWLLPPDLDLTKYIAGGLVVMELDTKKILWRVHMDLSTDTTKLRAYVYSSPTVVDLEGDGLLDVVIATSMGFIYAFDADGRLRPNFPVWMSEIQGQVLVEDVNGDGKLEICAGDANANVACFDTEGREVWETRISGFVAVNPTVGDVNGDGRLDVVLGTTSGHIWALDGVTGEPLPHFPIKTGGKILAPVTLTELEPTSFRDWMTPSQAMGKGSDADAEELELLQAKAEQIAAEHRRGLDLVVPSFDGFLYFINGNTGCVNRVDLGENSYSMVLVDDVNGNGYMDLLITTMNGNLFLFETDTLFHPLKTWSSQVQGLNGFTYRNRATGIYVTEESRIFRDIRSESFDLEFVIVDHLNHTTTPTYEVTVSLGGEDTLLHQGFSEQGTHRVTLKVPGDRRLAAVRLTMKNEHGQVFTDEFPLSFNVYFYRSIKWIIAIPFAAMLAGVLLLS
mgnify:FL=1